MEKKKIISILVLSILISGGIGILLGKNLFGTYITGNYETIPTKDKEIMNNDSYKVIDNSYYDLVLYNGKLYVDAYMDEEELNSYYGKGSYEKLIETRNKYREYDFGKLEYSKLDSKIKTMKIDINNVTKVVEYANGQSIEPDTLGLVILTKDGSVHIISYYSLINGRIKPKKIDTIKGIIDIKLGHNDNGVETDLITKDNEKINLYDYIPKKYNEW